MRRTTLDLPEELWEEIDTARGEIARNRWIRGAIEMRLGVTPEPRATIPLTRPSPEHPAEKIDEKGPHHRGRPHTPGYPLVDHVWVGTKQSCMRVGCESPREHKAHLGERELL